jgi:MFS family permease
VENVQKTFVEWVRFYEGSPIKCILETSYKQNTRKAMTATTSNRRSLFIASCASLLVTSLSLGIRAGILDDLGSVFDLDNAQIANITATAFWGFPISMIIGGIIVDKVGMKPLMRIAYLGHFAGILLAIFAQGYWTLWISTLSIGLANGMVEAVCNPLVASIYPEQKTTKLNHFHLWFPGGLVIGSLVAFVFGKIGLNWQFMMAFMLIPNIWYAVRMERLSFPVTERVAKNVSVGAMYKELLNPLFIVIMLAMFGTAISELFINQYVDVLLKSVNDNAILILLITAGVMTLGRALAAPVVAHFSTTGVLFFSALITTIGLFLMGTSEGIMLFVSAFIFGIGVTYFWPTMIGFVATYLPKTGAVGLAVIGGAGMFAVSIYMQFMGGFYDELKLGLTDVEAGREIIMTTLYIPIALIFVFYPLFISTSIRGKLKDE